MFYVHVGILLSKLQNYVIQLNDKCSNDAEKAEVCNLFFDFQNPNSCICIFYLASTPCFKIIERVLGFIESSSIE